MNQICTNKSQSSRLLEAGVRPETADMYLDEFELPVAFEYRRIEGHVSQDMAFPAWSLSKMIEMLPATISQRNRPYLSLGITKDHEYWFIQYAELGYDCKHEVMRENVLDAVVNMIEWLIKEGHLDNKYLAVKCGDCKLIEDEDANGDAWCSLHQRPVRCYSKACENILEKGGSNNA